MNGSAVERADWLARRLHLTNIAVGAVAVVIYLISAFRDDQPAVIPAGSWGHPLADQQF